MEKIKTKLRRFYFRIKHDYLSFDNIVFFIAIVACFLWTYSSISATSRNWELSQRIAAKRKELEILKLETEIMESENAYYRSAEYQELSARSKHNKLLEGEKLVYLPENSETARKKYNRSTENNESVVEPSKFSQWMSFLFNV